jgi:hypothetical protein
MRGRRSGQDRPRRFDGGQGIAGLPASSPDLGPVEQGEIFEGGPSTLRNRQRLLGAAFCGV